MRTLLCLALLLSTPLMAAKDEVYRWVDKNGVVHYGSEPPSKDAKPANLPQLQTYKAGSRAPLPSAAEPAKPAPTATVKETRILAPVPDEIFRDPAGNISVAVAVLPALPAGAGVVFYLDGAAKNAKPSPSTNMTFTGVERGEHTVAAAVVDASGKEISRSQPVTFYTRPPGLRP